MFIKGKSVYISALIFISTIIYSWLMKKPNIYNPQPEVKIITQKENINNIIKPELKIEKEIETKEPILPSNQGKNTDFFSIYDED